MADMKLGQEFCTIDVQFREDLVWGFVPSDWNVVDCRILAAEPGLVALVRDGGRVIFRRPAMLFDDAHAACKWAETRELHEIVDALKTTSVSGDG